MELYESQPELRAVIDLISDGFFSRGNSEQFQPLVDNLLYHDPYIVLADYQSYAECQELRGSGLPRQRSAGRACRFSTPRARASSPPIAPSASTAARSGTRRPVPVQLLSQEEVKAGLLQ